LAVSASYPWSSAAIRIALGAHLAHSSRAPASEGAGPGLSQTSASRKLLVVGSQDDPRDDDELLLASATGDGPAFAAFYRRHVAEVLAFLAVRVGSEEVATDLAGETFAGALLSCERYRPGEAPALAWLLGIARNKLRESARRGRVEIEARQRLGMPPIAFDDEDLLRVQELVGLGETALGLLEQLPAAQQDAVRARVVDELDYKQLALKLGHSEQVVRQHVSRGLRRLRTQMEEQP
jgi:RNA polymerase sigma factor (sigma-70 family)